jgi:hypothetical protein
MPNEPKPAWDLHETPDSSEWSFSVVIPTTTIQENLAQFRAYQTESTFKTLPWIPDQALAADDQFGLWLFTQSTDNDAYSKRFWYSYPKTVAEANVPFHVMTVDFGNHHWAAVLRAFALIEDPTLPVAAATIVGNNQGLAIGNRYYERQEFVDAVNEGTRFVLYEFLGPRPFGIPRHSVPQALSIQYTLPGGGGGSFPPSYHDTVTIPGMRTGTFRTAGGTTAAIQGGGMDEQIFPRTNHRRRRPYVIKDGNALRNGAYYRAMLRVFPPAPARSIIRNA